MPGLSHKLLDEFPSSDFPSGFVSLGFLVLWLSIFCCCCFCLGVGRCSSVYICFFNTFIQYHYSRGQVYLRMLGDKYVQQRQNDMLHITIDLVNQQGISIHVFQRFLCNMFNIIISQGNEISKRAKEARPVLGADRTRIFSDKYKQGNTGRFLQNKISYILPSVTSIKTSFSSFSKNENKAPKKKKSSTTKMTNQ